MKSDKKISLLDYIQNDFQTYFMINGCRSYLDKLTVLFFYPQLWATVIYRIGHALDGINSRFFYNLYVYLLWNPIRLLTSMEICPQATIGINFFIGHFGNMIIEPDVIIGNNCILSGWCYIGSRLSDRNNPVLEDGVKVALGATIIGDVRVGKNSIIGAKSLVLTSVPANVIVVGNPARVIRKTDSSKISPMFQFSMGKVNSHG